MVVSLLKTKIIHVMHVNKYVMTGLTQSSITVETVLRDLARDSYLGGGVK